MDAIAKEALGYQAMGLQEELAEYEFKQLAKGVDPESQAKMMFAQALMQTPNASPMDHLLSTSGGNPFAMPSQLTAGNETVI
jgi:hypothetical protein